MEAEDVSQQAAFISISHPIPMKARCSWSLVYADFFLVDCNCTNF